METMIAANHAETASSLLCKRSTASASAAGMLLPLPPFSCSCVGSRLPTAWRRRRVLQAPPSSSGHAGSRRPAAWRRRWALQAPPPPPLAARGAGGPRPGAAARRCSPRPLPAPPPWREISHLRRAARLWVSSSCSTSPPREASSPLKCVRGREDGVGARNRSGSSHRRRNRRRRRGNSVEVAVANGGQGAGI